MGFKLLKVMLRNIPSVSSGKDELTASVTFKTHKEARAALEKLQSKTLNGM